MAMTMAVRCKLLQVISKFKHLQLVPASCVYGMQISSIHGSAVVHQPWSSGTFFAREEDKTNKIPVTKPKQPAPAFILFLQKMEPQIIERDPDVSRTDIVKQVAALWRELDPEEKSKLAMQRKEMFENYRLKKKEYLENISPEQIKAEEKAKEKKLAKKLKLSRISLGMPKRPWPPFNCFLSEKFGEREGESAADYFMTVCEMWKNMDEKDRKVYENMSAAKKIKYNEDMDAWEKEMMEIGRFDVIRKSTLASLKKKDKKRS